MTRVPDVLRLELDEVNGPKFQDHRPVSVQSFTNKPVHLSLGVWERGYGLAKGGWAEVIGREPTAVGTGRNGRTDKFHIKIDMRFSN
jgi:hypothetical protein